MIRIWGRLSSINVRKVVWTARELGLEFERIDAGAQFGEVRSPTFLAMNPNGLVPLLEDDEMQLWESNVIVRYLCAKFDGSGQFYPQSLAQRFDAERWMDWQQTTFNPAGRDAFLQLIRVPEPQRQVDLISRSIARTEPLLEILEQHLQGQSCMAGPQLSMADIPLACEIHRWFSLPLPHVQRPGLQDWFKQICARPAAVGLLDQPLS